MIWDEDEGGCIDGRRLGRDEEGESENAERDDCTEEDGCEGHRRLIKKDAEYEVSHISKMDCTEDDDCGRRLEDDESSDENEREEEHNGDVQSDHGAKRLLRATIQN